MEKPQYQIMSRVEDDHFWYQGMRKITQAVLDRYIVKKNNRILDAGCGTGANLVFLRQYGTVTGIDISREAIRLCRSRGLKNVKIGTINSLPYPDDSFDLVTCFDVLGQQEVSPRKALSELSRVTKHDGLVFIRTAAFPFLMSFHDRLVHTERRFTKLSLNKALKDSGFSVLKISYVNAFLFPAIAARRILLKSKADNQSDVFPVPSWLNKILLAPFLVEAELIKYFDFPFGVSLIVSGRKV